MWAIIDHLSGDQEHERNVECWRTRDYMLALAAVIIKLIRTLDMKLAKEQNGLIECAMKNEYFRNYCSQWPQNL